MYSVVCSECGNLTKVPFIPDSARPAYCPDCLTMKHKGELASLVKDQVKNASTKTEPFSIKVKAQITEDGAVYNALMANASAFRAFGGSPLMLTEHVENGIDAIKERANWNGEYTVKNIGKIEIIIDTTNEQVIVIDDGTGIEDPIWILQNPLRSRKTGLSNVTGKYGRGLQGFRGFCKYLEYITVRKEPNKTEIDKYQEAINNGVLNANTDPHCVKLTLNYDTIEGDLRPVNILEFRKYTNNKTGTVAIFKDWLEGQWEELLRNRGVIFDRIQHHFRHDIETELIEIYVKSERKEDRITAYDYSKFDLYDMPREQEVTNPKTGQKVGTIQYFLYRCSGEHKHRFKFPFLLAKDNRPLQDSFIHQMPQFLDEAVWKSPYVTGYIKCDFVEPDPLRISFSSGGDKDEKNQLFVQAIRNASIDLKREIAKYQKGLNIAEQENENRNIVLEVQNFLRKQKIKLDLPDLSELGVLQQKNSDKNKDQGRISDQEGNSNAGRIVKNGSEEIVVLYEKEEGHPPGPGGKPVRVKERIRVTVPEKDGKSQTTMLIDPEMLSKKGRRFKRPVKGIMIQPVWEKLNEDISYYDPNTMEIKINFLHKLWEKLDKLKQNSSEHNEVYSKREKNYIRSRYIWELIKNFYNVEDGKYEKYWELNHQFFVYKGE